jgi:hypothetical protein
MFPPTGYAKPPPNEPHLGCLYAVKKPPVPSIFQPSNCIVLNFIDNENSHAVIIIKQKNADLNAHHGLLP